MKWGNQGENNTGQLQHLKSAEHQPSCQPDGMIRPSSHGLGHILGHTHTSTPTQFSQCIKCARPSVVKKMSSSGQKNTRDREEVELKGSPLKQKPGRKALLEEVKSSCYKKLNSMAVLSTSYHYLSQGDSVF